jgi:hypothetical protein
VAKDKARAAIDKDTADNDAQILEAELRYDQAMGTTPFFSTFEDAEGQTWLLNQNTGHRMRVGKPDAAKKRIQLGNTLLGIKDDGKAEVLYEAPKDRIIKEYNGITYEYDPRDPKGTMKELFRDPYWKETQELGLEKTRADIAKAKADVETGKIGALEARSRIEKDLLELEHPKTEALGSGDFIVRRGGKATVHYYGGDTKTFEAGPLPESTRSAIGRMRESLSGLDKPAAPAASTSVSKTGAETAPSARIEVTEVKPTEKTAGEEMGGAGERFKPGWPGSDPRLSGTLRPPSKQTTSSGDIAHYDEHGNLTGIDYLKTAPPHYGEEGYPGSEGYEAEAGLPKNPNWMAEEEEDEYGAGADMDPREGNWWDIDPQRYKDFINWLRQHGQEHEASQPEERFWDPEHPQIQGGGGNMSPPDLEGHPLMRGIIGLGREDIERASPEERFDVANSRDLAPRGPSDWTSEPSLEGDTQYPRDPNRPEETIGTSEVTRRRNPSDVFEEGAELWQERSAGGDPDAITNADRLRRDFPNAPFPENFDEWWPDDQVKFVTEWGQSLPPEEQDRLRQAQVDRLNERLAREREDDFDPESRRREMYGMDRDLEDDLYQPSERTGDPDDFNPSGPDQWAAWEKATERFRHPSLFEDNPGIEHDLPDGFFDLSPEDQQAFVDQWQTRKRAEWEQQASPEEQEQIERARQDFLRDVQGWDPIKEPPGDKPFIYDPSRPEKPPVDEGPVGRDDIENWLWHLAPGEDWGDRNNSTIFDPSEIKGGHTPAPPWHEILNQPSIFKPPSLPTGGHIPVPLPKLPGGHAPGPEIKLPDIVTSIKQRLGAGQGPGEPMGASPAPMGAPPGMGQPAGGQMGGWQPPVPPGEVAGIGHRFGQPMNEGEPFHSGVDLQAQEGAPTVAPADGIVEEVRNDPDGLGLTVIVRDQQGMQHKLGHLSGTDAYRGMVVAKGQNLAQVGSSGNTTGSHLHWAVRDQQGQPQDPTPALGPMGNLPPVPGTEMMGPPGGTGSPPGAAGGMPALPPGLEGGVTPPQPGDIAKSMGMGQDVDLYWDPHNMGAGADGDDDPGEVIGITPSQQANIDAENKRIDMERETRMAEVAQRREAENNRHQEAVAKLEQDWKIHQDNARLQAEKQAEDARHNQAMEAIERERIQADIEIQQMRDANAIRLQQMQQGNQIYLQQGEQAFADFQKQQEMRMEILGSALKNPWMQRLSGMTPGPNYQGAAVPGGQNISTLVNQILTPYDADKYGWQNAPGFLGLDQANAGAAGALPQPGQAGYEEGDMYAYQQQGGAAGGAAQGGAQGGAAGQPALFQQGGGGAQAGQQMGGQNWTYDSAMGAVQGGQGGGSVGAQMAGGGDQGLEYGQNAPATFGDWRAWDPFQKAAYRANIEALGPGAWEQVGQQMADRYAASGGTPDVTAMQAAGGGELGRAGAEMTGELWGQAPEQFWNEQNRQWSRARGPQVQQKLTGQYRV